MKRLVIFTLLAAVIAVAGAQFTNDEVKQLRKEFNASYAAAKAKKMDFSAKFIDLPGEGRQKAFRALEMTVPAQGDGMALVVALRGGKEVNYSMVPILVSEAGKKTWSAVVNVVTDLPASPKAFDVLEIRYVTAGKRMTITVKNKTT